MPERSDADAHSDCNKLNTKILVGTMTQVSGTVEDRLAELERKAGLHPSGADADGRKRRIALLSRIYGVQIG